MTTEIYPQLNSSKINEFEKLNQKLDQKWLINSIIKPELPRILETLSNCLNIITSNDDMKLPITTNRNDHIKGIIVRNSSDIIELNVDIYLKSLNKRFKLQSKSSFEICQINELISMITKTMIEVHLLIQNFEDDQINNIDDFIKNLNNIRQILIDINENIDKPKESLSFPKHSISLNDNFIVDFKPHKIDDFLALDVYILKSHIVIEIISFEKIKQDPWNKIDFKTGKSYIENLRKDISENKKSLNFIIDQDKKSIGHYIGLQKYTGLDYFKRGITFNNKVIIITEKIEIQCQDPYLLVISTKLNSLEHLISRMCENLNKTLS
ncbi:hypothetical protein WICMUC_002118 [Wickerhamomyces mucosus]|uniref:Regulator of V-ATPase in vacuolar membrane protein 2 n=1 Tax=Wickerhamomyces mucosus TaxID=1378264 RepID=A0A9P8PQA8_9ASCO|nr:hypothetical protein WICMUC_002118 [Wickerhamomyces mucosus]